METTKKECKVIFKKDEFGNVSMYREYDGHNAKEGFYTDESIKIFIRRLTRTMDVLSVGDELVLVCEWKQKSHAAS